MEVFCEISCVAPTADMVKGAEKSRELFQYVLTCHAPDMGVDDPAMFRVSQKH